jgi:hypothetical protein
VTVEQVAGNVTGNVERSFLNQATLTLSFSYSTLKAGSGLPGTCPSGRFVTTWIAEQESALQSNKQ